MSTDHATQTRTRPRQEVPDSPISYEVVYHDPQHVVIQLDLGSCHVLAAIPQPIQLATLQSILTRTLASHVVDTLRRELAAATKYGHLTADDRDGGSE